MRRPRVNSWKSTWATPFRTNCTSRDNATSYTARVTSYLVRFINCCSPARDPRISSTSSFARGSKHSCETVCARFGSESCGVFRIDRAAFRATCCKFTKFGETASSDTSWDSLMRKDPSLRIGSNYPNLLERVLSLDCPRVLEFINYDVTLNFHLPRPTNLKLLFAKLMYYNCDIIKNFTRFICHFTCHYMPLWWKVVVKISWFLQLNSIPFYTIIASKKAEMKLMYKDKRKFLVIFRFWFIIRYAN